jgi:nicotinamide riboside kinase
MKPPQRAPEGGALCIALVGAESTGKTALAAALQQALTGDGLAVAVVDETLRSFCDAHGRTPTRDDQWLIARTHTRRIEAAAAGHDIVLADTTALMTAVYSEFVFGDRSLYPEAEKAHRRCRLSLLTALDLPWVADGLQRDGPQVREPVDTLVRAALGRIGGDWAVVGGLGPARTTNALAAVRRAWQRHRAPPDTEPAGTRWQWHCERCGDAACERHLLPRDLS